MTGTTTYDISLSANEMDLLAENGTEELQGLEKRVAMLEGELTD